VRARAVGVGRGGRGRSGGGGVRAVPRVRTRGGRAGHRVADGPAPGPPARTGAARRWASRSNPHGQRACGRRPPSL
jgi:hypothetical protein